MIHNLKKDVEGLQKQQKDTVSKVHHYIQTAYDVISVVKLPMIIIHLIILLASQSVLKAKS